MLRKISVVVVFLVVFSFIIVVETVSANQMVFRFISPFFGGSPLNANYLSFLTGSQNRIKEPYNSKLYEKSPLESFKEDIIRQSLSMTARKIVNEAFGEDALEPGTYNIAGYSITIASEAGAIVVVVTDPSTGESVTMEVPYY